MIARPYGLSHPPDITVEITQLEWTRTPVGRLILRTKVRIHNANPGAVRTIRQHWLICPGYPNANYGPLSLQTPGLSQVVGPVKPGELLTDTSTRSFRTLDRQLPVTTTCTSRMTSGT